MDVTLSKVKQSLRYTFMKILRVINVYKSGSDTEQKSRQPSENDFSKIKIISSRIVKKVLSTETTI